jgi:phosphoglycerate kinase
MVGGGMANTFLAAGGLGVGRSLCERDMLETARQIAAHAREVGCELVLPSDAVVAPTLKEGAETTVVAARSVPDDQMILDIGPVTVEDLVRRLGDCRTCVWNGPLGAFEVSPFDAGTVRVAAAAAELTRDGRLLTVAGGGDTVAALRRAGVAGSFSYVSMAGGAFLEWLEGKTLPGVEALEDAVGRG